MPLPGFPTYGRRPRGRSGMSPVAASRRGRGTCGGPQRCRLRVSDIL